MYPDEEEIKKEMELKQLKEEYFVKGIAVSVAVMWFLLLLNNILG